MHVWVVYKIFYSGEKINFRVQLVFATSQRVMFLLLL